MRFLLAVILFSQMLFSLNEIKSTNWNKDKFIVTFEENIKQDNLTHWYFYHKGSKKYKYIYDIKHIKIRKPIILKEKKFVDTIVIGQYKIDKLRISFRNNKELDFNYKVIKNRIIFDFHKASKSVAKTKIHKESKPAKKTYLQDNQKRIIVIDAGHGGKDGGAVYKKNKAVEKVIALNTALYTKEYLEQMGYTVFMTRETDVFIKLINRTKFANKKNADLFISIHVNSLPKKGNFTKKNGIETYFLSPAKSERAKRISAKENYHDFDRTSKAGKNAILSISTKAKIMQSHKLAIDIQNNVIHRLQKYYYHIRNNGVKSAPFWVLVGAQMPSILLEIGYITGNYDGKRLLDRLYKKRLAKGIANGVDEYFQKN